MSEIHSYFWCRWGDAYSLQDYLDPSVDVPHIYFAPYYSPMELDRILVPGEIVRLLANYPIKIVEAILVDDTMHYLVEYLP